MIALANVFPYRTFRDFAVSTSRNYVAIGDNGLIVRSSDAGATWTIEQSGTSNTLYKVAFISSNEGYAIGTSGTLLHTTDGGTVWQSESTGTDNTFLSGYFASNHAWLVGANGMILTGGAIVPLP